MNLIRLALSALLIVLEDGAFAMPQPERGTRVAHAPIEDET